jgi:hypothetical protein
MNDKILFSEQQKFRQPWLWIMLIAMLGIPFIFIRGFVQQVIHGQPWGDNPMSDTELIICTIVVIVIIVTSIILLWITRLETFVTSSEINVKFFPFQRSFQHFKWEDIVNASIQKINPMKQGGWGFRSKSGFGFRVGLDGIKLTNFMSKNVIYSVSGKYGLQLELKNGKKVIIGTGKAKELEAVIYKLERNKKEY